MTTDLEDSAQAKGHERRELRAESDDDRRRRWAHLLESQHFEPVVFDVLSDELPKYVSGRVIDPTDIVTHMRECACILASAPRIFFAAVGGNLVSRMLKDAQLQAEYTVMQQNAHHQPSIYIHLLANEDCQAPSPVQYLAIHDMIQEYISDCPSAYAHQVDSITSPPVALEASKQGHRKHLSTLATNRSPKRIATLNRLITGIASRCAQVPHHMQNLPLSYPPSEVGYALNAHKRLTQHRLHQSSNYIMNLVDDVCTYLYRTNALPKRFKMHQYIIYLIFRPNQAAIAEIFCSGLLQCWVDLGGFNAYPAGRSVASSQQVRPRQWDSYLSLVREMSPLVRNMQALKERARIWQQALQWEDETKDAGIVDEGSETAVDSMDLT